MRYYTLSNCFLAVPDELCYLSDSIMVQADFMVHGVFTLSIVIDGDQQNTLTAQLTESTTAVLDLSYYLRSHYAPPAMVTAEITVTGPNPSGAGIITDTAQIAILLMYGKTYAERTHFAEGVIYTPEGYPVQMMTPLQATITTDDGEGVDAAPNTIVDVKSECVNSLIVDFSRSDCVGDCGWAYGIEAVRIWARRPGSAVRYRLIITPEPELNVWRINSQSAQLLNNNYLHTTLLLQASVWGNYPISLSEYDRDGQPTGLSWELDVPVGDGNEILYSIAQDAAEALYGLSPDGETILQVRIGLNEAGAYITANTLSDRYPVKIPACPSLAYLSTMLYYIGFTPATCRHSADLYGFNFVTFGDQTPDGNYTHVFALEEIAPYVRQYRFITADGGVTFQGGVTFEEFLFDSFSGDYTFNVYGSGGGEVTMDKSTLIYHFLAPACQGYLLRNDDGKDCPVISYHPATGDVVTLDGGIIHAVRAGTSVIDLWDSLSKTAGVEQYTDQVGRSYTFVAVSACCEDVQTSISRGTLWCMEDVERYTVEVRHGCQRDCRGLWLQYYNADGLLRWLPVEIVSTTTGRDRIDYRRFDPTPVRWPAGTFTTAVSRSMEVVALDIPPAAFVEDILTSPIVLLYDTTLTTAVEVVVDLDSVSTRNDETSSDYVFKLKSLA